MASKTAKKRNAVVIGLFFILFFGFAVNLFRIQIIDSKYESEASVSSFTVTVEAVRGEILDRNGYPLVTNRQVNKIVFNYDSFPRDNESRNRIISQLIALFDKNNTEWNDNLPIEVKGDSLSFTEGKENEVSYLKSEAFLDLNYYATVENCYKALSDRYSLEAMSLSEGRDVASVYYSMVKNGFNTGRNYVFASDVSNELVSVIMEKSDIFPGVNLQISSEREYTDGTVAPHVLGMVGPISEGEYEAYKESGYTINDVVGKSGIELTLENQLRGTNGVKKITVDSRGNRKEEYTVEPVNGNTVILTIDYDVQKVAQKALADGMPICLTAAKV